MSNDENTIHGYKECYCTDDAQSLVCPATSNWCTCLLTEQSSQNKCSLCDENSFPIKTPNENAKQQEKCEKDHST